MLDPSDDWRPTVWQYHAHRAFELANERLAEADRLRLAHSVPRPTGPGPLRRSAARAAIRTSRAIAGLATVLDACALDEGRA